MIKGAIYELKRDKDNTQLGWKHIQLVERRKTRTITSRLENFKHYSYSQRQKTIESVISQTVDEYEWVCLGDGEPNIIDENAWGYEVIGHYDFIAFAEGTEPGKVISADIDEAERVGHAFN